ncbi:MAG: endonuclease domain-containing protein, partial [Chloroflexota bacterium]
GMGGQPPGMGGQPPGMGGQPPGMGGQPPGMGGQPPGMGGQPPGVGDYMPEKTDDVPWTLSPEQERAMTQVARLLRKNPTPSEDRLWQAIRKEQLDGRKFRRQMPIGPFVVDFYCPSEQLAVEVDGPIHESQREADRQRQIMLESLGLRFVRVTAAQVENDLPAVLHKIRAAFLLTPHPKPLPHEEGGASDAALLPSPLAGEGPGMGGQPPKMEEQSPEMRAYAAYRAISAAAAQLHAERDAWLNPPGVPESQLAERTLTNLYNALAVFRGDPPGEGKRHPPVKPAAGHFAPRLDALHRALDEAVCDAYGWEHGVLTDEEEILRRLLALNLERATPME